MSDGGNPSFQRAIPHAMDGIDLLLQVVIFGVSPGSPRVVSQEGLGVPLRAFPGGVWEHSKRIFQGSNNSNPDY